MKMKERITGTQAPSRNFITEAEKYSASMDPKKNMKATARKTLLPQQSMMTRDIRQVVTSITVITAKPAPTKDPKQQYINNSLIQSIGKILPKITPPWCNVCALY